MFTYLNGKTKSYYYSKEETIIGEWVDGKPIYRKCFLVGQLSAGTSTTVKHGITGFDRAINIYGSCRNTSSDDRTGMAIPFVSTTSLQNNISIMVGNEVINISHGTGKEVYSALVIIEYLKL